MLLLQKSIADLVLDKGMSNKVISNTLSARYVALFFLLHVIWHEDDCAYLITIHNLKVDEGNVYGLSYYNPRFCHQEEKPGDSFRGI